MSQKNTAAGCPAAVKALTKSRLCQAVRKPARRESKLAKKGVYQDVNDRILQVQLTMEAKIYSFSFSFVEIFAFAGFVSGLTAAGCPAAVCLSKKQKQSRKRKRRNQAWGFSGAAAPGKKLPEGGVYGRRLLSLLHAGLAVNL